MNLAHTYMRFKIESLTIVSDPDTHMFIYVYMIHTYIHTYTRVQIESLVVSADSHMHMFI